MSIIRGNVYIFQVLVPMLTNEKNHEQWPSVVSNDVRRHVHTLKSNVYVVSGQVSGKTLLPFPVGTEDGVKKRYDSSN